MHDSNPSFLEDTERGTEGPATSTTPSSIVDEKTVDVRLKSVDTKEEDEVVVLPADVHTFPEGGWMAWSTIAGGFLVQFTCFGYINSFGVYQDFYVRRYLRNYSTSTIGWIGGVQIFLNFAPGIIAGRLFDRGYFRYLITSSILIYALSIFTLSLAHENSYYQIFLTNGVGLGLASGLTYTASLALPGHYFRRRRAVALGIVSSGSAVGGVLHPIMLNKLINGHIGFHNGVRISASLNVFLLVLASCLMRTRLPPKPAIQSFPVMTWLREPSYLILFVSAIPCFLGLFFPPFYIQLNAISHGVDPKFAFYSVAILNAGSYVGRIIPPLLSARYGVFNLGSFFTVGAGIIILSMIAVKDVVGTVFFGLFFGIFSGASIVLTPAMFSHIAQDPTEFGTRFGLYLGLGGLIGLFATPILGALLTGQYHWSHAIILSGLAMAFTGLLYFASRHFYGKNKGTHIL